LDWGQEIGAGTQGIASCDLLLHRTTSATEGPKGSEGEKEEKASENKNKNEIKEGEESW
jgi:hypothetical protein